ncbi:hypothetical protein [Kineothrix sp. MB12-C1]|uniref:hypothetical protein n=1 Tax=Kineothrix sp. MB12-C1 TaxID=3070215 RepID=UPI0027D24E8E|nr:hypothetical protein [Kineothrix sp. MB12-C1]WMC92263.1 hypothetical protein RBB56_15640 [Kineothrix sp. MB12-C1]
MKKEQHIKVELLHLWKGKIEMFATFKMNLPEFSGSVAEDYYSKGIQIYKNYKKNIETSLDKYLSPNGELRATEIEKDWFPEFRANIFLSHSHKDERKAITLAGFLSDLGLATFIDSCVWGYADNLLKQIDNEYCVSKRKDDGSIDSYSYEKRNQSTAHVHMLLNGALMKMMDKTECLIFLDTPNSLKANDIPNGTTDSGWIYSELLMSKCLQRNSPVRKSMNFALNESFEHSALSVEYDADISHLILISKEDIINAAKASCHAGVEVLDQLYVLKKIYKGK